MIFIAAGLPGGDFIDQGLLVGDSPIEALAGQNAEGNMSYSYYLVHGFVIFAGVAMARRIGMSGLSDVTLWIALPMVFAATLVPSFWAFVAVEKPFSLTPRQP